MSTINGFVHIIESPSGVDLLDGRTEGRVLGESLRLAEIPHCYSLAADRAMLLEALGSRLWFAWQHWSRLPILHLSTHGNANGVGLTSGERIAWHDLRQLLLPLIRAMQGGLLICMSSCFGSSGFRMAMSSDSEPTFWALVGNTGSPTWADAAIAYTSFYHLFFKGLPVGDCVQSMKVASGDHRFQVHSGAVMKAGWQAFVAARQQEIVAGIQEATKGIDGEARDDG